MQLADIGHRLKAFRIESGLKADEIATRLGISRAALYRYEKGEVIKLDTVQKLAELLDVSPLSLLGIGVEYFQRQPAFLERIRQIEETTDMILEVGGLGSFAHCGEEYYETLKDCMRRFAAERRDLDQSLYEICEATIETLDARRRNLSQRQPSVISVIAPESVVWLLRYGLADGLRPDIGFERRCRRVVLAEIEQIAEWLETPPMRVQLGLLTQNAHTGPFQLMRQRDRSILAVNPFGPSASLPRQAGVAIVTAATEAVTAHQKVAETLWRSSTKGRDAAAMIRSIVNADGQARQAA